MFDFCNMAFELWIMWAYIWFAVGLLVTVTILIGGEALYRYRQLKRGKVPSRLIH